MATAVFIEHLHKCKWTNIMDYIVKYVTHIRKYACIFCGIKFLWAFFFFLVPA